MKYTDIPRAGGKDNMGGFSVACYFAPLSAFTTIKGVVGDTLPGDSVTIDGPHVFESTKGWIKAYTTLDTAKLAMETIGERSGRGSKITGEFFIPRLNKQNAELARNCKNDEFILILKDINSPAKYIQIASEDMPAEITSKFDSGTISSGKKGFTFMFEAFGQGLTFYETDPTTQLDATFASSGGPEDDETYVE